MRRVHTARLAFGILASLLGLGSLVPLTWAQTTTASGPPPVTPGTTTVPAPGGHAWLLGMLLGLAVLVVLIGIVKAIDLKRQREDRAVVLQAQIADALLRDRALVNLSVVASVHVPLWQRTPATVEMHGQVPTGDLRQAVLRVAAQEAARFLVAYHIEDRIAVVPSAGARAA